MKNIALGSPLPLLLGLLQKLRPYVGVMIFLLLAATYGFIIMRINSLSNPAVDPSAVLTEVTATPTPRIDANAAEQLQSLKDNNVNVQTLFEEGRTNPFQE